MAPTLATPVLVVDTDLIHKVDTRNVENLFSMWTVFSKCAGSVEQGRRLENLSWRLWNRETFCCEPENGSTAPAITIDLAEPHTKDTTEIPELSSSMSSNEDEEAVEFDSVNTASVSAPLSMRPRIVRQDSGSSNRSRGRERHINPDDLEKMVITIKQTSPATIKLQGSVDIPSLSQILPPLNPLPVPAPVQQLQQQATQQQATPPAAASTDSPASAVSQAMVHSESASGSSERSCTSIVRGFSPSQISNSYRSIPIPDIPSESAPKSILAPQRKAANKIFALGGSSQSGDSYDASSMESRIEQTQPKKKVFKIGASSASGDESSFREKSVRSALCGAASRRPGQAKKQTSFMEEVEARTISDSGAIGDDAVFETDDEDDIDESAIDDDDDSSDWEDSIDDSGKSSIDEKTFFQRVDSRMNLTSRRSMLTTLLHQGDRAAALGNIASKSTPALFRSRTSSPNGPSLAASPDSDDAPPLMMKKNVKPRQDIPRSTAQPIIMTTTNTTAHQVALSPKTTRRNMLASELTASLRRNLLWERQQKNSTASAVLKRRHTAHSDLKDIKEHPQEAHMDTAAVDTQADWNRYFGPGAGEYHTSGW